MGESSDGAGGGRRFDRPLEILTRVRGVLGGLVATGDGLPLAVHMHGDRNGEVLAAAAAAIGRLARRASDRLGRGAFELGVFDGPSYRFLVQPLSVGFLLVVAEPEANVHLISTEMSSSAAALNEAAVSLAVGRAR